jgi:hypothetical protein
MIYCLGDSHVSVFAGRDAVAPSWEEAIRETWDILPEFRTFRIGPFLAYSVGQEDHLGRRMLFSALKKVPKGSWVLLVFGEIDCRSHLLKQRDKQSRPLNDVASECVGHYMRAVKAVCDAGFKTMVFGGLPTGNRATVGWNDDQFAHYGTSLERNEAARLFDLSLKAECSRAHVPCLSIFDLLVDENGITKEHYYLDAIHLSTKAMPLIKQRLQELGIDHET